MASPKKKTEPPKAAGAAAKPKPCPRCGDDAWEAGRFPCSCPAGVSLLSGLLKTKDSPWKGWTHPETSS